MTSRWLILGLFLVSAALIAVLLGLVWSGQMQTLPRALRFGLPGALLATTLALTVSVLIWRRARGRPLFGVGMGLIDIIEIVTGGPLSPDAQTRVRWIAIGIGVLMLVVALGVVLARRLAGG
jgi:hypothetical protein